MWVAGDLIRVFGHLLVPIRCVSCLSSLRPSAGQDVRNSGWVVMSISQFLRSYTIRFEYSYREPSMPCLAASGLQDVTVPL